MQSRRTQDERNEFLRHTGRHRYSTSHFKIEQVHSTHIALVHSTQFFFNLVLDSGECFNPESLNRKSDCLTNAPSHSVH